MSKNIILDGQTYNGVSQVELPVSGGTALFKDEDEIIVPTGTKQITANGTDIDVTEYAAVDVSVPTGGDLPTLTNPASASDILSGKEALDGDGAKLVGTCTFDADTSDADATASDIAKNKTAYVNGQKVVGTNEGGGEASIEPFDTYEFSVAEDAIYTDEQGTESRTFATLTAHSALINYLQTYIDKTYNNPLMQNGKALILTRVEVKNPATFVASVSNTFFRKDEERFIGVSSGNIVTGGAPYCRKRTVINSSGTKSYKGSYENANDNNAIYVSFSGTTLSVRGVLSQYNTSAVKAGDYVLKFYDLTDVME